MGNDLVDHLLAAHGGDANALMRTLITIASPEGRRDRPRPRFRARRRAKAPVISWPRPTRTPRGSGRRSRPRSPSPSARRTGLLHERVTSDLWC